MIKTRDYVDEQGPKYKFYSFFTEAKHLVTWYRALFAVLTSFCVSYLAYGFQKASILVLAVFIATFFSGHYAEYLLAGVMGDYLGATICVTEVYLLTILTLLQHEELHSEFMNELVKLGSEIMNGKLSFPEIMEQILKDDQKLSLFKFVGVGLFTIVWCSCVGHPPVFVRKSVAAKKNDSSEDEIMISLVNNEGKELKVSSKLQSLLADPEQTFTQRYDAVRLYIDSLAKPVGSLGTLEDWAARLAALQCTPKPSLNKIVCLIFAADHGVAKDKVDGGENSSNFPQAVTRKVLEGLEHGLAGASVLAKENDVLLRVIDVGLAGDVGDTAWSGDVVKSSPHKIIGGTKNFCTSLAMTDEEVDKCIQVGRKEVQKCVEDMKVDTLIFGEVGIGNTTTSSALIAALTGESVDDVCGSGATTSRSAIDESMISKKIKIVKDAIDFHGQSAMIGNPTAALRSVGGAEITAIVGGILEASERNIAVLVDGFIVTTAAMIACQISSKASRILLFATKSTEKGQVLAIQNIQKIAEDQKFPSMANPALDMGLRMGEATGGLTAVGILRSALAILSELATLQEILQLERKDPIC